MIRFFIYLLKHNFMKKLLILVLISSFYFNVNAQSLSVTGSEFANPLGNDPCLQTSASLTVRNISSTTHNVLCEKIIIDTAAGTENFFCWGANCYGSETYISTDHNTLDPGEVDNIDFGGYYDAYCNPSTATVQYCFYPDIDPTDRTCVTITYNAMMSNNVSVISDSQTYFYPNPSSTTTKFMFSEKNCSNLIVLDNLGKTVKNIILHNQQSINIDISDLHHGIYFAQLIKKNRIISTKKLIIQ